MKSAGASRFHITLILKRLDNILCILDFFNSKNKKIFCKWTKTLPSRPNQFFIIKGMNS